jgi:anti-anti-sigma regulatory factor
LADRNGGSPLGAPLHDSAVSAQDLAVQRVESGSSIHLLLGGHLDAYSASLPAECVRAGEREGCCDLVIDLGNLSFVDSRSQDAGARSAPGSKGWRRLKVVNPHGSVKRGVHLTQLGRGERILPGPQPEREANKWKF